MFPPCFLFILLTLQKVVTYDSEQPHKYNNSKSINQMCVHTCYNWWMTIVVVVQSN